MTDETDIPRPHPPTIDLAPSKTLLNIDLSKQIKQDTVKAIPNLDTEKQKRLEQALDTVGSVTEEIFATLANESPFGTPDKSDTQLTAEEKAFAGQHTIKALVNQRYSESYYQLRKLRDSENPDPVEESPLLEQTNEYMQVVLNIDRTIKNNEEQIRQKIERAPLTNKIKGVDQFAVGWRLNRMETIANALVEGPTDTDPQYTTIVRVDNPLRTPMDHLIGLVSSDPDFGGMPMDQWSDDRLTQEGFKRVQRESLSVKVGNILNQKPELAARSMTALGEIQEIIELE